LFSFILLIIIVLWRPSNISQRLSIKFFACFIYIIITNLKNRFAFTPLLDNDEDNEMDDKQEKELFGK
jgi:hypothetical protein